MREQIIAIKVTPKEKEIIKGKAQKEGLTISAYIRHLIMKS